MNIQRKYSLPNCTLLLEGLSDVTRAVQFQELRPELSILVNAECYLSSYNQPLVGGREFFESLVRAVSGYAQEFLSNVPNPQAHNQESELVELWKIDSNRHRLIVHSEVESDGFDANRNHNKPPVEIDLNTVQLFDLVEAVDQFFADSQTLPELSLELQPVARSSGIASQALVKQAVPAGIGVSGLAVAALAFSLIPAPQVRPPEPKPQEQTSSTIPSANPGATSTPSPIAAVSPTATPIASATPTVTDLEALLNTVPEITDASQLRALNRQLYNKINPAWANRSGLSEDLVYRVGVAADGEIVGYKAVNRGANEEVGKTPLPNLLYNPASRTNNAQEPIAQFRVVFTREGIPEVSPWRGYTKTPEVIGVKITDSNTVKDLNEKLYNTVRQNWAGKPNFERDLKYRVAVNKDGAIADYEPLNQLAVDYQKETPLPTMLQARYGSNLVAPKSNEPLAHYEVVFQASGKLEVMPWQGYR
ncbi:MAG: DUF4335 domain-containing protein [Gloeotrichia echinulata IR180]|jgi:hypothetical protein|nr:DUF4335 domain-containing protein [Gloeotrichia echinulata DEX184]